MDCSVSIFVLLEKEKFSLVRLTFALIYSKHAYKSRHSDIGKYMQPSNYLLPRIKSYIQRRNISYILYIDKI